MRTIHIAKPHFLFFLILNGSSDIIWYSGIENYMKMLSRSIFSFHVFSFYFSAFAFLSSSIFIISSSLFFLISVYFICCCNFYIWEDGSFSSFIIITFIHSVATISWTVFFYSILCGLIAETGKSNSKCRWLR